MAFDWPSAFEPETVAWQIQKSAVGFRSPMAGSLESVEFPGQFWKVSLTLPPKTMAEAGRSSAFFARLTGGAETVNVPYWPRRVPQGTMRGSPTVNTTTVRGDLTLLINTTGTLIAGDAFSVGGQLFVVFEDCAAVAGVLTVKLVNRVRAVYSSGAAVVWDRPTAKCNMPSGIFAANYMTNIMAGLPIDLEEVP